MLSSHESKLYITVSLSPDLYIYTHISVVLSVYHEVLEKIELHTLDVPKLGCLHSATQKSVVLFVAN